MVEEKNGLVSIPKTFKDVLIYDIETETKGPKPNSDVDIMKFFGAYSYKTNKYYVVPATDKKFIKKLLDKHNFIVGFNNLYYDNPILERHGYSLEFKRIIDLRKIIKSRAKSMNIKKGNLGSLIMKYSLDYITRLLGIVDDETAKDEIDYNIFKKNIWSEKEQQKIIFYTERDLQITKKLFEWVVDYFEKFKDFVRDEDVEKKYYLTDTMAKFGYKADCHAMEWEPVYDYDDRSVSYTDSKITGGYVAYPAGAMFKAEIVDDNTYKNLIIELDFSSLYPHIMIMCNLHNRNNKNEGWHGGHMFNVEGYYNDKELGGMAKLLRKWYFVRMYYKRKGVLEDGTIFKYKDAMDYVDKTLIYVPNKKGVFDFKKRIITKEYAQKMLELSDNYDDREYTIKILINLQYGILNTKIYSMVYDAIAGGDCTRLGRQFVKYARKVFREAGYKIIYTDTDSWYFVDVFNDKNKYMKLKDKVISDIMSSVPFPQITFDADIDAEIKYMFFFKSNKSNDKETDSEMDEDDVINKPKGYMKKNYIYVTTENELVIKNLGIVKKNISALSKKIFWDHLVPQIKSEGKIKFYKTEIHNLMKKLLSEDVSLAYMRKEVGPLSQYKKSKTSIQAQISTKYGPGIHFLIPNIRNIGVGKSIKYCSIEEFKKYDMDISDIDFTNFWKELNYFVKPKKNINLFNYGEKK